MSIKGGKTGRPQGERPSQTTKEGIKQLRLWQGRSPCGRPSPFPTNFPLMDEEHIDTFF